MNNTNIIDWIKSENLYNKDIYRPILLMLLLVTFAYAGFGTIYDQDNIMLSVFTYGMLFFLLLFLMLCLPFWLPIFHPKTTAEQNKALMRELRDIDNEDKKRKIYRYLTKKPKPFHKSTLISIIFIGCFMLMAFLITRAWIYEGAFIVLPSDLSSLLDWLRNTDAVNWFIDGEYLNINYISQQKYTQTAYSDSINLLQFYRLLMLCPVILAALALLWNTSIKGDERLSTLNFIILFIWICLSFICLFSSPDLLIPALPLAEFHQQGVSSYHFSTSSDLEMQMLRIGWLKVLGHATLVAMATTIGLKVLVDLVKYFLTRE